MRDQLVGEGPQQLKGMDHTSVQQRLLSASDKRPLVEDDLCYPPYFPSSLSGRGTRPRKGRNDKAILPSYYCNSRFKFTNFK